MIKEEYPIDIDIDNNIEIIDNIETDTTTDEDEVFSILPTIEDDNDNLTKVVIKNKEDIIPNHLDNITVTDEEKEKAQELIDSLGTLLKNTYNIESESKLECVTIPTGIDLLDCILGGGISTGLVQVVGNPGAGKSALAGKLIASGQKKWPGKFIAVYCDSEETTTIKRLSQLGVNSPKIQPYRELTVEKIFQIIEGIVKFKSENKEILDIPSVIVWDTLANTQTENGLEITDINKKMGLRANVLSQNLPRYISLLNKYNICLFIINQVRSNINIGMFKPTPLIKFLPQDKNIPGGNAVVHNSIQMLYLRLSTTIEEGYGFNGIRVQFTTIRNKLLTPNISAAMAFEYERGFSNLYTNYDLLKTMKKTKAGGAYVKLLACPDISFFQKNLETLYYSNDKFKSCFDNEVLDCLNIVKSEYNKYGAIINNNI